MTFGQRMLGVLLAGLLGGMLLAPVTAQAGDGVPLPNLAEPRGENCVEDVPTMRRNHMDYLKHQRDETLRQGIRGRKYSLTACIECHAAPDGTFDDKRETLQPFCGQCHEYAAVKLDCFECHNPTRQPGTMTFRQDDGQDLITMLKDHLGATQATDGGAK